VELPQVVPFSRLQVPAGEEVLWYGYNPTFHRFLDYGLVLTRTAIYVCRRSWWLVTHWRRTSLDDVIEVELIGNSGRPGMRIRHTTGTIRFHTPFDFYQDEMDFDRGVLEKAVAAIRTAKSAGVRVEYE
jgi:hypothetical protein